MKRLIAIAMCAIFAGCLEPQQVKVEIPAQETHAKAESIFDSNLGWTPVKTVKIYTLGEKKVEVEQIAVSSKQDIDRALKEGVKHWITDSIFIHESADFILIREYRRDAPRFYEYPRSQFVFEFQPK
jgi:hypothetical protein